MTAAAAGGILPLRGASFDPLPSGEADLDAVLMVSIILTSLALSLGIGALIIRGLLSLVARFLPR